MAGENLLSQLRALEVALHRPEVRSDAGQLDALLHEDFSEIGRSARRYLKADILEKLPAEATGGTIRARDFHVQEIAVGVALPTDASMEVNEGGVISRHTVRASL